MIFLFSVFPSAQGAVTEAQKRNLARDIGWRRLLHYHKGIFGGEKSDVDGPNFFLSKTGRRDPRAELEATLTAFANPAVTDKDAEPPQCRFPAREHWLRDKLGSAADWPKVSCERFESWRSKLDPTAVSLIFASYYMNNPASLYGHTFLKLKQRKSGTDDPLLDYTVNFSANVASNNGLVFAVKGLTGGYPGAFTTEPYYLKIQKYNNVESRDLWEYYLNLNQDAVDRLVEHVWELGHTSISYYFLNRNCSYQLLPVIEAVSPQQDLSSTFHIRAVPLDTLRAVLDAPGLVSSVRFRPSHLRRMRLSRDALSKAERRLAEGFALGTEGDREKKLEALAVDRQVLVLDAAYNYLHFKAGFWREQPTRVQASEEQILRLRNKLPAASAELKTWSEIPASPQSAHGTGRVSAGWGTTRDTTFEEIAVRGALHDLESDPLGFVPGSGLESALFRFRFDNDSGRGYLEEGTLMRIKSLAPWEEWVHKPSWHIQIGYGRAHDLDQNPEGSGMAGVSGGTGVTVKVPYLTDSFVYSMIEGDVSAGGVFDQNYRAGAGGSVGLLCTLTKIWRAHLLGSFIRYGMGDVSSANRLRLVQSFKLARNFELRLDLSRENHYREGALTLNSYF